MLEDINIWHGDCLDKMKEIPDNTINLIVADPPYNIKKAHWDKIDNYIDWCGKWILECQRVLKDNGSFYCFHNDMPQIAKLMQWIELESRFVFKQFIVWNKYYETSGSVGFMKHRLSNHQNRNYYAGFTEYCLFYTFQDETGLTTVMLDTNNFSSLRDYFRQLQEHIGLNIKGINKRLGHRRSEHCFYWKTTQWDLPTPQTYQELAREFNIDKWQHFKPYEELRQEYEELRQEYEELRQEYEGLRYTFNNQKVMTPFFSTQQWNNNVWNYGIAENEGHETPKPIPLIENILLHSSNEGDLVLDPFMGSGTTAIACRNLKRRFIGIEKEKKYIKIARRRLVKPIQLSLDLLFQTRPRD